MVLSSPDCCALPVRGGPGMVALAIAVAVAFWFAPEVALAFGEDGVGLCKAAVFFSRNTCQPIKPFLQLLHHESPWMDTV